MTGSRQVHGWTISYRAAAASSRRLLGLGARLGVVVALAVMMAAVCAASASAVIVEGPGGKSLSYQPLAGASQAAAPGVVPRPATSIRPALAPAPECYPDTSNIDCVNASEEPLVWGLGPVMPSTTTYFIYWDPKGASAFPAGYASGIKTYFKGLAKENGSDQNQYSILTQYYGQKGGINTEENVRYETHLGKAITDKDPYPAEQPAECEGRLTTPCISDSQIEAEIGHLITANKLPPEFKPGGLEGSEPFHIAYFVLLPPGVSACWQADNCSGVQFCGYHSYSKLKGSPGAYEGLDVYAVQPYGAGNAGCDNGQHPNGISDAAVPVMVHELSEMITDPYKGGWINSSTRREEEVADICNDGSWAGGNQAFVEKMQYGTPLGKAPDGALYNQVVGGRDYYYQQLWSNETNSCQQRRGLPPTVTKIAPAKGSVAGNSKVKITGLNFQNPTVTAVAFGKVPAKSFTVTSPTSLTAVSPQATSAGPVDVTVTTSAGTSAKVAADQFTYEP